MSLIRSIVSSLALVGLVAGSAAAAGPRFVKDASKGSAIAARREAASDFTRANSGYYGSGSVVRARDVRTTLLQTSKGGTQKLYRAREKGPNGWEQEQRVKKFSDGWRAFKRAGR